MKINIQKTWLFFERYTLLILAGIYFLIPPSKDFELYSNLTLTIIIYYLYLQINIFTLVKIFNTKKKNLGERWLRISVGGDISEKMKIQIPINLIAYGIAFYLFFQKNDPILAEVYFIVLLKDIMIETSFYGIVSKIFLKKNEALS